ncbi:carotenoid 1,2-hydratase [Bacterioplanes sanyensis]|uniref:Carotenoid 1,2-hydratase n=1 Tax=Bacterioplanes sanyensis TaxID=1249553 RepID=A0A222FJ75_9GAMM|nr:lipocalin-like domain-containing protein [Bacterioplanes sanyensis]ASP38544.1 carotenoid 1,2-hydratase [Bacterioplanes sanyensis]
MRQWFCAAPVLALLLWAGLGYGQQANDVYQVLRDGDGAAQFAPVLPGYTLDFPRDHGSHPDFRIEWWYLTANLEGANGQHYGVHFTLFRQALFAQEQVAQQQDLENDSPWASRQSWMAHAAISQGDTHLYEERFARGGIGQAGVQAEPVFDAWLDDWQWLGDGPSPLPGRLTVSIQGQPLTLQLSSNKPWVLHGEQGFSQKSEQGQASYYYSQPSINIVGQWQPRSNDSVALTGQGWLDREWSSQPLAQNQSGWDWFSLQLADGHKLMAFRLRHSDSEQHYYSGSWITPEHKVTPLNSDDIQLTPTGFDVIDTAQGEKRIPTGWQLSLPELNRQWQIKARSANAWLDTLFPYWEGPVQVFDKEQAVGVGYLEMTGY